MKIIKAILESKNLLNEHGFIKSGINEFSIKGVIQEYNKFYLNQRYSVCKFPSLLGTPIITNSFLKAKMIARKRSLSECEARIIDNITGNHYVYVYGRKQISNNQ